MKIKCKNIQQPNYEPQFDNQLRHPFDTSISTVEDLKTLLGLINEGIFDSDYLKSLHIDLGNSSPLLQSAFISPTKDLINIVEYCNSVAANELSININEPNYIPNFSKKIIENIKPQNTYDSFKKYVINYYFEDPLETPKEKIEFINHMKQYQEPKKYVLNLFNNESEQGALSYTDKALLNLGHTPKENWNVIFKPILTKYFFDEGVKKIKTLYYSLPKVQCTYKQPLREESKSKELQLFNMLTNIYYLKLIYETPSIIDYESFLLNQNAKLLIKLKDLNKNKESLLNQIDKCLKNANTDITGLKEYIQSTYKADYQKMFFKDCISFNHFAEANENEIKQFISDDIEAYNHLKDLENGSNLDKAYYKLLLLNRVNNELQIHEAIKEMNDSYIQEIKQKGSNSHYFNESLKELLSSQTFKRNEAIEESEAETKKGNIATYSNNVLSELCFSSFSIKSLSPKELEIAKSIIDSINECEKAIEDYKKKLTDPATSFEESEQIRNFIENEKKVLNHYQDSKKEMGIVSINGEMLKCIINSTKTEARLEETKGEISLIINDFQLSRQKSFSVLTKKNNKDISEEHSLTELTPKLASKYSAFISMITKAASNTTGNIITMNLEETKETLMLDKKRATSQLKYFLTMLQLTRISNAKVKANGKESSLQSYNFISWFNIDPTTNIIQIELTPFFNKTCEISKSKIWNSKNIKFNSTEEYLINEKAMQLINQAQINSNGEILPKSVRMGNLVQAVPSFNDKINSEKFERDLGEPFYNALSSLNRNPESHIRYNYPTRLSNNCIDKSHLDDIIKLVYAHENDIPAHIQKKAKFKKKNKNKVAK